MCGIFGFYSKKQLKYTSLHPSMELLCRASNSRGKEASGIAIMHGSQISYTKTDKNAYHFLKTKNYRELIEKVKKAHTLSYMGHARMSTNGTQLLEKNNQPVISARKKIYCVHNGIVANYKQLWQKLLSKSSIKTTPPDLDTQVLVDFFEKLLTQYSIEQSLYLLYQAIEGVANLAIMIPGKKTLVLSSNTGSLYWFENSEGTVFFASEKIFLSELYDKMCSTKQKTKIRRVPPTTAIIIQTHVSQEINLSKKFKNGEPFLKSYNSKISYQNYLFENYSSKKNHSFQQNKIKKLKKHEFDYERIYKIHRCSKCILPITTPFITFNEQNTCNYCLEHTKITFQGADALEQILKKYRKKNKEPDCLVAFSGGRDSSYGLHLLKKEFGMNPLAYTYDWGMISDLGRRNQARMLGKLGVEQILVSADISQKRKHIKANILAWLKKPHLGMIPLFMEGDKQCEFYANQIMKKYNLELMIYCRGNELEKEEFKAGHSGVRDADPGGVIHNLAFKNKMKLVQFYGLQYLQNPAYFNSSLFDTAFAFFSTYIQTHNYLYLWHYLPWQEKTISRLLQEDYNWETSPDTKTTWRIGDGTPAFYNYIYYQVQGFTENDSLRARQVREGIITRETALHLVREENKPQYNNLKWYFDTLELDGDMVLSVIDTMKKLY